MFKIKTLNKIADAGLSKFDEDKYIIGETDTPDAIMVRSVDNRVYYFSSC